MLQQVQDTLFTVNLPILLPLTYYTYNERSLFLVWVAGGGRRWQEVSRIEFLSTFRQVAGAGGGNLV